MRPPHAEQCYDLAEGALELAAGSGVPGLRFQVLRGWEGPGNEGSRAVLLEAEGERALLLGDAEGPGLFALLASGRLAGPVRLLLAPHHGSLTPWFHDLLESSRPSEVWVSASEEPPVGAELERRRIPWKWTGRDGPLCLELGQRSVP